MQAYLVDEYRELLEAAGFGSVQVDGAWGKETIEPDDRYVLVRGVKQGE